jgi:hypothetical protein
MPADARGGCLEQRDGERRKNNQQARPPDGDGPKEVHGVIRASRFYNSEDGAERKATRLDRIWTRDREADQPADRKIEHEPTRERMQKSE